MRWFPCEEVTEQGKGTIPYDQASEDTQRNYSNTLTVTKPALFGVQGDGYRA